MCVYVCVHILYFHRLTLTSPFYTIQDITLIPSTVPLCSITNFDTAVIMALCRAFCDGGDFTPGLADDDVSFSEITSTACGLSSFIISGFAWLIDLIAKCRNLLGDIW